MFNVKYGISIPKYKGSGMPIFIGKIFKMVYNRNQRLRNETVAIDTLILVLL